MFLRGFYETNVDLFKYYNLFRTAYDDFFGGKDMTEESKQNNPARLNWTTSAEIKFLDGLGGWRGPSTYNGSLLQVKNLDQTKRLRLLSKYKSSMKLRKNWGSIDRQEIFGYLSE